jgi:outer membrane receptor for ferrienterochelin and colicin
MRPIRTLLVCTLVLLAVAASATIFGSVRGLVHDPHHRPVQNVEVMLSAENSNWSQSVATDDRGEFHFDAVPLGQYQVTVSAAGFASQEQKLTLASGRAAELHFALTLAQAKEVVEVSGAPSDVNPESSTVAILVSREQIQRTPGADQSNSLAMITNYVPSAVVTHDQLHVRGGHQVSWLVDGVPIPNTNIASNVGPQFDPKDIDYLEVQRGGFSAEYGDRAYGVFNVVTRSGFERDRQGELVASYGNFNTTNDQVSFGSHSERFAYYSSLSGYRSDYGLETPISGVLHDQTAGLSAFGSLIFNRTAADQFRLVTSVRGDHYQVPNDLGQHAAGFRDVENERDAFVNVSWLHTPSPGVLFTVSPFYHFNRAHYDGHGGDTVIPLDDRGSNYFGGVISSAITRGRHNARLGFQVFGQRDNQFFGLVTADGRNPPLSQRQVLGGNLESLFLEDQYKVSSWLTLNGGVRLTRFAGQLTETKADPRMGAAVRLPRLGWVLRAFYGRYYQAPPLLTPSGPILDVAAQQGFDFLPLRGERDQQMNYGLTIPVKGWTLEGDYFRTNARNFFDHDALGNSNIFFPLTIDRARIRGTEVTLRSPRLAKRVQLHLAYSRQYVQGSGGVSGGLTDFTPPEEGLFYLDHDQRDTLSTGATANLPWRSWISTNLYYGSGFLDGDGPNHLSPHTTFDLSLGKAIGESWSLGLSALNVSNHRYRIDSANTFGGTHYASPRQLSVQLKYRFRY